MRVTTYILLGGKFVEVDQISGRVADDRYVEGAIEITMNGRTLLSRADYDYVVELWSYFLNGLVELSRGGSYQTGLPDQPVTIRFELLSHDRLRMVVDDGKAVAAETVNRDVFVSTMAAACRSFFGALAKAVPRQSGHAHRELERLRRLGW